MDHPILRDPSITYVRFQWIDFTNQLRYRIIPIAFFRKLLSSQRPGISFVECAFGLVNVTLAEGFSSTGEYFYAPDLSTLVKCGYAPGHASVLGFVQIKNPSPAQTQLAAPLCPRHLLRRVVATAKAKYNIDFKIGFETEFILLSSQSPLTCANPYGWSQSMAIPSGSKIAACLEDIAGSLTIGGIELEMYHSEGAPGQYEYVTGPCPPLEAVDKLIATREIIYNTAAKHGFKATLTPRLHLDNCGSAAHMHFSLKSPNDDTTSSDPHKLSSNTASFLQSLLSHLPSLCLLTLPTIASYDRMKDLIWSGGTYASWGIENRETPIRMSGIAGNHHFELRCMDGTANPYVAVAAILHCGMLGVERKESLTYKPVTEPPSTLSEARREEAGISSRLPLDHGQAVKCFSQDGDLRSFLGDEFVSKYLAVNKLLNDTLSKSDGREVTQRMVEMY